MAFKTRYKTLKSDGRNQSYNKMSTLFWATLYILNLIFPIADVHGSRSLRACGRPELRFDVPAGIFDYSDWGRLHVLHYSGSVFLA